MKEPRDIELQAAICRLMLASTCFGREVCPTPPCACAQSLIDAVRRVGYFIEKIDAST